jgi:hypothetical protein
VSFLLVAVICSAARLTLDLCVREQERRARSVGVGRRRQCGHVQFRGNQGGDRGSCFVNVRLLTSLVRVLCGQIWSGRTRLCLGTCRVDGYCLTVAFAPGGRYVVAGTKEGKVQVRGPLYTLTRL